MVDITWVESIAAGAICFGSGMLGWMKNPRSKAATLFMLAMMFVFLAFAVGGLFTYIGEEDLETADSIAKVFTISFMMAQTFLWELAIVFPVDREVRVWPPDRVGAVMVAAAVATAALGSLGGATVDGDGTVMLSTTSLQLVFAASGTMIMLAMALILHNWERASVEQRHSATRYLMGLWIFVVGAMPFAVDMITGGSIAILHDISMAALVIGAAVSGLVFFYSIAREELVMRAAPTTEVMASSSKASFKLLHRHVYLVEEEKPEFSFKMFADILKGRCFDCENDDSFPCESIECGTCKLPCPCRTCTKYKSRAQGLIVTRQFPTDVRSRFFIQTTPILWLSTVAGKDNMDPAKISTLTDYLVNFMEKSHNGVVLVDGVEYLVTSNDFQRVLRSVDKWTETAMTSSCRLVVSVDPRAFSDRELALLEKNKEVVRPSEDDGLDVVVG